MKKSMKLSDYHYPYVVLISKFLLYFWNESWGWNFWVGGINTRSEQWFTKKNGFHQDQWKWVSKDGDHGGSSSVTPADFDEEDQDADMNV